MSDDKKGLPKPDGEGRWAIYYKGNAYGHIFNVKIIEGVPCHANGLPIVFSDNDQWHRCYVPGLDEPQNDIELLRDLYFKHRHEIADLRAERDAARQEVERLTNEKAELERRLEFQCETVASLRGETDKPKRTLYDLFAEFVDVIEQSGTDEALKLLDSMDGALMFAQIQEAREESRAT